MYLSRCAHIAILLFLVFLQNLVSASPPLDKAKLKDIENHAERAAVPELLKLLEQPAMKPYLPKLEEALVSAARKASPEHPSVPLLDFLKATKSFAARESVHRVLAKLGDWPAIALLAEAAEQGSKSALQALADWPTEDAADFLLSFSKSAQQAEDKEVALNGYIRMLRMPHEVPAEQTVERFQEVMEMATTLAQKREIVAGLSELPAEHALPVVQQYQKDPEIQEDVVRAIKRLQEVK